MTAISKYQALTEMAAPFFAYWGDKFCRVPNTQQEDPTDPNATWAEITVNHSSDGQSSLKSVAGTRYTATGLLTVSLYFPLGIGLEAPMGVAEAVQGVYRGKRTPSDVWFRQVQIIEPQDDAKAKFYRLDVVANFTYDQIV